MLLSKIVMIVNALLFMMHDFLHQLMSQLNKIGLQCPMKDTVLAPFNFQITLFMSSSRLFRLSDT